MQIPDSAVTFTDVLPTMAKPTPNTRRIALQLLAPHPLQALYHDGESEADEASLAADLAAHGQREPIVVMPPKNQANLPPYTILDGHRRAKALRANGDRDAEVLIRHDLAAATAEEVEATYLNYNFVRRQLHQIDQARVALRLFELEKGRPRGKLYGHDLPEARDRVGQLIGMSGRNLQRYFRLLQTPVEVQRAVRDAQVTLVQGEKVAGMDKRVQMAIAERIRAGEPPKTVVMDYLASRNDKHVRPLQALDAFARSLRRSLADLEGRLDQLSPEAIEPYRATLRAAHVTIGRILNRCADSSEETIDDDLLKALHRRDRLSS